MPIDALSVSCAQLTRDLLAIAKFLFYICLVKAYYCLFLVKKTRNKRVEIWTNTVPVYTAIDRPLHIHMPESWSYVVVGLI